MNDLKSDAIEAVRNILLPDAELGSITIDPAVLAEQLVDAVWDMKQPANTMVATLYEKKPEFFDWKSGQAPHKLSVAAIALANGEGLFKDDFNNISGIMASLGALFMEIREIFPAEDSDDEAGPFGDVDHVLIILAFAVLNQSMRGGKRKSDAGQKNQQQVTEAMPGWDDWVKEVSDEAVRQHPDYNYEIDDSGTRMIDLILYGAKGIMLKAFNEGVTPDEMARYLVVLAENVEVKE